MSSRALRRAQRELEEKKQLEQLAREKAGHESDESEMEEPLPAARPKPSLFAMLGNADNGEDDEDEDEDHVEPEAEGSGVTHEVERSATPPLQPSKKTKKKKKRKGKGKDKYPEAKKVPDNPPSLGGLDEIDQALLALSLTSKAKSGDDASHQLTPVISEETQQLFSAMSVDVQHLQAANEMRKLFGRAANDEPRVRPGAVADRNAPRHRNLASLGLRRNVFIQGKEEWPRATSGGLGMELVETRADGSVEYRFVHGTAYQSIQRQFETCVASMDPDRMIQLLHFNPYHISTLLQVSEIAKQQRDNATAGDLLERALFSFGRAVHSTFSNNLARGKARLDFRRPENREFWLAVWRYIATLGIRATWRTAFEWGKLLLSMAPERDPYCLRLLLDQLALRGREPQALVDIVEADRLQRVWKIPPNLAYSVALAHDRLKQPEQARKALRLAIKEYPWMAARLCKELEISPIPKPVWGKEPNGDYQELLCELYVPRAKDLWNTTGGTSLLVEVCYSVEEPLGTGENPYWLAEIDELDLARHVVLSDDRSLLSLLDPRIKSKYTSTSDPLPPDDSINSYSVQAPNRPENVTQRQAQLLADLNGLRTYFQNVDLQRHMNLDADPTEEELLRALEEAGTSYEEFRRNTERVQMVMRGLNDYGIQVRFQRGDGAEGSDSDEDND